MKSEYRKIASGFRTGAPACALLAIIWTYVPDLFVKLVATLLLAAFGTGALGLGMLCGEDDE